LGTSRQLDRIDLQQETRGAPVGGRGGIEDVGFAKCKLGGMEVRRILVKKKSEIPGLEAGICDVESTIGDCLLSILVRVVNLFPRYRDPKWL
jgi:hypothetical protein